MKTIYYELIAQTACKKFTKIVVQKRHAIIVQDMHSKVTKKVKTEVQKTKRALE